MTDTEKLIEELHRIGGDGALILYEADGNRVLAYSDRAAVKKAAETIPTLLDRISSLEGEVSTLLAGADADAFMISDLTAKRASLEAALKEIATHGDVEGQTFTGCSAMGHMWSRDRARQALSDTQS